MPPAGDAGGVDVGKGLASGSGQQNAAMEVKAGTACSTEDAGFWTDP